MVNTFGRLGIFFFFKSGENPSPPPPTGIMLRARNKKKNTFQSLVQFTNFNLILGVRRKWRCKLFDFHFAYRRVLSRLETAYKTYLQNGGVSRNISTKVVVYFLFNSKLWIFKQIQGPMEAV